MPQTVLSLAKTTQPTLTMVVERSRLFTRIASGGGQRAVWISGPPGAGKTTCIASYLQSAGRRALWYQLDSSDADIATFFLYLRQSAIKHSRQSDVPLPELPAAAATDWQAFARRLFRAIFARYSEPLILVLDNFEAVTPHSGLHAVLAAALEEIPAGSMIVFASREAPLPAFARAAANGSLLRIEGSELALSAEEFRQLAKLRGIKIPEPDLLRILQHSAGWVTGAILMLEFTRRPAGNTAAPLESSGALLYDYLAQEVFTGFDPATRTFFLKVCWPRRLGLRMAQALGEESAARQLLTNLARNNYFVSERFDSQEFEYVLHPLLRDFLQAQARRTLADSEIASLQRKTAILLAEEGQIEEAVELLSDNLDWPPLEDIIVRHAALLATQGRTALLAKWLEELPPDRLNANGWLPYWLGAARIADSPREARRCFESAVRAFEKHPEGTGAGPLLAASGAIAAILREMDDLSLLDPWIAALRVLLARHRGTEGAVCAEVMLLTAIALREPGHAELPEMLRDCQQSVLREDASADRTGNCLRLLQSWLLCGEIERAGELLVLMRRETAPGAEAAELSLLAALHDLLRGDGETARELCSACLKDSGNVPAHLVPLLKACEQASAMALGMTDRDTATSPDRGKARLARFFEHYLESWRGLLVDEIITALHEQRMAQSCAAELGIPFLEVLSGSAYAQLLFRCGDTRAGNAQLRRVHSLARDLNNPLLEFMALLIYAEAAIAKARASSGSNALRYALGLGRRHGYYYVPWWRAAQLADLLALALEQDIETDYVRDFVLRRKLQPTRPPVDVPGWPWPLRITTLGGLSVTDEGNHEIGAERIKGRPLQVLKVLLAFGAREVPAQKVAQALWPHVDSEYSDKSLTINLHRLRRLLGHDDAILLRDGQMSINPSLVWLDLYALEAAVARVAAGASVPSSMAENENAWIERLSELCRGPFLPEDSDLPCFAARREACCLAIQALSPRLSSAQISEICGKLSVAAAQPA